MMNVATVQIRQSQNLETLRLQLDNEIESLQLSLSDFKTRRDTLPPMAHLFDNNVLHELQEQIRSLESLLHDRRARRNTLSNISKFPDSVLITIFMFAREYPSVKYRGKYSPQLAVCTYICKYWRTLILAYPILWNNINLSWPYQWVVAWFSRSQPVALDITMDMVLKRRYLPSLTPLIFTNSFRLRKMRIAMVTIDDWKNTLQNATPLLELLELQVLQGHPSQLIFPQSLFGGQAPPLLRNFGFYGPHSVWSSPLLPNLTTLKVDQYPHQYRQSIHLWEVLRALQRTVRLQHLHLEGEAFPDDLENPERIVVSLPLMASVLLRGPIRRVAVLLDHLIIPTTAAIALYFTASEDGAVGLNILLQYFSIHFHETRITAECTRKFDRVMIQQHGFSTRMWVDGPEIPPPFSLELPLSGTFEYATTILCNILPLTHVKTLCISGREVSQALWTAILEKMQEIQVLDMGHLACLQFSNAVASFENILPLYNTHTLGLCWVDFGLAKHPDATLLDVLFECLVHIRGRQGLWRPESGLKTVELYHCTGLDNEFVRKLQHAGFDVKVDEEDSDNGIARRSRGML